MTATNQTEVNELALLQNPKQPKWYQAILFGFVGPLFMYVILKTHSETKSEKHKLKYFKPTITTSFWGNTTTWIEREKPLTDNEVNTIYFNK